MKNILITGAASGLGLAISHYFLDKGWTVFGTYRQTLPPESVTQKYPGKFIPIHVDVTNEEMVKEAVVSVKEKIGSQVLTALINNAAFIKAKPISLCESDDLNKHFQTNVIGPFLIIKHFSPLLEKGNHPGKIINVNSLASVFPLPFQGAYGISKSGLSVLTNTFRLEKADHTFSLVDIWLGMVQTEVHERNVRDGMDLSNTRFSVWAEKMIARVQDLYHNGMPVDFVAAKIFKIVNKPKNSYIYIISKNKWKIKILLLFRNTPLADRLIKRTYFGNA